MAIKKMAVTRDRVGALFDADRGINASPIRGFAVIHVQILRRANGLHSSKGRV